MSFREENNEDGRGGDLRKPFLHTGSWYRMGSAQTSSMLGSSQAIRDGSISVLACVMIVALGPIQFGFTVCIDILFLNQVFFFSEMMTLNENEVVNGVNLVKRLSLY